MESTASKANKQVADDDDAFLSNSTCAAKDATRDKVN
jgi:hypothetical protein